MLRKFNRTLAYLLSFALVMSIFGQDYTSFTSIAADEDYAQEVTENQEETQEPAAEAPQENYEEENNSAPEESYDEGSEGGEENYDEGQPEEPAEEPQPEEPQEEPQPEQPEAPETPETPKTPEEPETPEAPAENPEQPSDESGEGSGEEVTPPAENPEDASATDSSTDEENSESATQASSGASIEDDEDAAASASSSAPDEIDEEEKEEKKEKKEKEKKEVETQMPAADFYGSAGGMNVSVHADEGAFPEGTEMVVSAISAGEALDAAVEALGENVTEAIGVDISFRYEEQEIEPANAAAVHVNISLSSSLDGDSFSVVHKDDDGSVEKIADACADGASFETGSFSIYIVAGSGDSSSDEEDELHATATYNFYVGENIINTQIVKKGDTLSDPGIPDLEDHQVFHGWFISGTDTKPPFGVIDNVTADAVINIDARIETTYYLTFKGPSGETIQVRKKVVIGNEIPWISTVGVDATPTGETQAFVGWTTEEDTRTDETQPDNRPTVAEVNAKEHDVVYAVINTAHWITFEPNDGGIGGGATYTAPVYVLQDQLASAKKPAEDPSRKGYIFGGWYTTAACSDADLFNWNQKLEHDIILYAKWTANNQNPYTVVIWMQKASDAVNASPKTYDYVESHNCQGQTNATITRAMISQYLGSKGNGFENARYEIVKGNTGEPINYIRDKGDTVVNVYYDRKSFTLSFQVNNGYWNENWQTVKEITALYQHDISGEFPIANHVNSRWNDYQRVMFNKVLIYIDSMPDKNIVFHEDTSTASVKSMKYYVKNIEDTGYILFKELKPKYNYFTKAEDFFAIPGFTADYSDPAFNNSGRADGNEIKFYYNTNKYTLTFKNDTTDVKVISNIPYEKALSGYRAQAPTAAEMEKIKGFEFVGWYVDANGLQEFNWNQTMPANNLVVYAYYKPLEYTVHLEPNGGEYTAGTDFTLKYIKETGKFEEVSRATLYNNISRDGYELVGWFWDDGSNEPYAFGQPTCNIRLIAKWRKTGMVKINYVAGENGIAAPTDNYLYSPSSTVVVSAPATPKEGYTFICWKIRNDTSGRNYYPNNCFEIIPEYVFGTGEIKNVYLDAVFEKTGAIGDAALTTLTYKANGGYGADIEVTGIHVNESITALTQEGCGYTKDNCELIGWSKTSGGSVDIGLGQRIAADNDEPLPNVLYAVWEVKKVNYTIRYYKGSLDTFIDEVVKGPVELGTAAASITLGEEDLNAMKPAGYRDGVQQGTKPFTVTADGPNVINVIYPTIAITVTLKGHTGEFDYDSEEHTVSGYDFISAVDEENAPVSDFTAENVGLVEGAQAVAKRTDVGTNQMGLSSASFTTIGTDYTNVTFEVTDGAITIKAIDAVVVTITGHNNTATYDGNEHSVSGYDVSVNNSLYKKEYINFTGTAEAAQTLVGSKNMGLAADQFENTNDNFTNVTFNVTDGYQTIKPLDVTVTITGHNNAATYDGNEHSVSGYDVEISNPLYKESYFGFSGTAEAKRTDVGTTNMGLAADQFTNTNSNFGTVTFAVTDGSQTINPIDVTVTITGHHNTATFDNEEHSVSGYDVEISNPLYTEDDFSFSGTAEAKRTDVGTTDMGLAADRFTNTNDNFATVTFNVTDGYQTITGVDEVVVVTITGHTNTTDYDGNEHSVSGYDVEISNPLYKESYFSFSGTAEAKRTDVGTTNMGLAADQFTNTNSNFGTVTFNVTDGSQTINPIDVTVTITGHHNTATFDNEEHSVSGYDVEISNPLYKESYFGFSGTAEAKRTDVGTTNMGLAADQFTNTNSNFGTVTFAVTDGYQTITGVDEVVVTITGKHNTATFDNEEHSVSGYDVEISNPLYKESYFSFSGTAEAKRTDVGTTNMGLAADQFTNNNATNFPKVTFEVTDGYQTIDPANVTITVIGHTDSREYDGEEHTVEGYEISANNDDYLIGEYLQFNGTATAAQKDAGKAMMGLTPEMFVNGTDNFKVTAVNVTDGYQEITPKEVEIKVVGHSATVEYNGKEQSVTGYEMTIPAGTSLTKNDVKFVGSATASGIALGTYKMGLTKDQFSVANKNYKVTFEVTDGTLTITGTPGAYNITITSDSDEQVYTGETFGGYGYTVSAGSSAPRAMAAMSEAEFTEAGSDKVVVNGAAYTVTGITVDTTAREVGEYDVEIKGDPQVIDSFGNNVTELFTINKVTGKLVITPMAITVTSASASKVYDGTPLTSDEITEDPGWGKGDVVAYNVTGSQTEVGTSKNTFEIVASEDILKNYTITKVEGDLEVTAASTPTPGPTPTPDTPTPTPTPDTPTPAPAPTTIDDAPVPMSPTVPAATPTPGVEQVLGARRETTKANNAAVLGARRGKTDDETNTTSRAFAIILAAAAALALIIKVLMKKEEDEEA